MAHRCSAPVSNRKMADKAKTAERVAGAEFAPPTGGASYHAELSPCREGQEDESPSLQLRI